MKIILLKDVPKVGRRFDIKDVSDGYATNMLIPRGLAKVATKDAVAKIEAEKAKHAAETKVQDDLLIKNILDVKGITLTLALPANEKGHLFAAVTKEIISEELSKQVHASVAPEYITLARPLKEVGSHTLTAEALGKSAEFVLTIEAK